MNVRRTQGFTLTELMVSLAILGMVSLYLTSMMMRQGRAYAVVDHVTEVQQNTRAISEIIEREIRVTGLLVPEGVVACGRDETNAPDILFVTDSDALSLIDPTSGDPALTPKLEYVAAVTNAPVLTSSGAVVQLDSVVLDDSPSYDTTMPPDGVTDSDFRPGSGMIIFDADDPTRGVACGIISAGPPTPITPTSVIGVDFAQGSNETMPASPNPRLVAVPAHWYTVQNNQLLRNGRVIAEDVEDFQVAYYFDLDEDGFPDLPMEFPGASAAVPYISTSYENDDLRSIRINFVVRSRAVDQDFLEGGGGEFQPTENRAPILGADGFRRRVYTASIRPRNLNKRRAGGSGL